MLIIFTVFLLLSSIIFILVPRISIITPEPEQCHTFLKKEFEPDIGLDSVGGVKRLIRADCHIKNQLFKYTREHLATRRLALEGKPWMTFRVQESLLNLPAPSLPKFQPIDYTLGYVTSAFLERRVGPYPEVKVLYVMPFSSSSLYCQLKCGHRYISIKGRAQFLSVYGPVDENCVWRLYVLHCSVTNLDCDVTYVSVTSEPCVAPTNNMTLERTESSVKPMASQKFGICLNTIFDMNSKTLPAFVQFMEAARMLGDARVYLYGTHNISSSAKTAIKYYEKRGTIHKYGWTVPKEVTSLFYFGQVLQNMDCLYRHGTQSQYLLFLDIDEILLPIRYSTWSDMLSHLEQNGASKMEAGLSFQRIRTFPDLNVPAPPWPVRGAIDPRAYVAHCMEAAPKMLARPRRTLEVGVHRITEVLPPYQPGRTVDIHLGVVIHLNKDSPKCPDNFVDPATNETFNSAWKEFTLRLIPRVANVLNEIKAD